MMTEVFVCLRPSSIHGVGVFAVSSIPENTLLVLFDNAKPRIVPNSARGTLRKMAQRYGIKFRGGWACPHFNRAEIGWYLNHSIDPNVLPLNDGISFLVLRRIRRGEEVTVNYRHLPKHHGLWAA